MKKTYYQIHRYIEIYSTEKDGETNYFCHLKESTSHPGIIYQIPEEDFRKISLSFNDVSSKIYDYLESKYNKQNENKEKR